MRHLEEDILQAAPGECAARKEASRIQCTLRRERGQIIQRPPIGTCWRVCPKGGILAARSPLGSRRGRLAATSQYLQLVENTVWG